MSYQWKRLLNFSFSLLALLALTACQVAVQPAALRMSPTVNEPKVMMPTAALRASFDMLLGEHVLLAASATSAALHGRDADFKAAAGALDQNSQDLAATIGSVYGDAAAKAFLPLWRTHIGFFVDYTNGVAKQDKALQAKALADLTQYAQDFGAFLQSANPNLPKEVVAQALAPHVKTLTAVIDAQGANDNETAFKALRQAYAHMDMIAGALAGAIGNQFPDKFTGAVDVPAANLRSALTTLLAEHTYLAAMTTDAALGGRDDEFKAAAGALDQNSQDLAAAIGSVYGAAAAQAFLPLWRTHIGFFVDYTNGVAQGNQAAQNKALADLTQYAQDFGAFLASANPNLTKEGVAQALVPHVKTLTEVINAQATHKPADAYPALRQAYGHMGMIADTLSAAISKQFPDKFGTLMVATVNMTNTMTITSTNAMSNATAMTDTAPMSGAAPMTRSMAMSSTATLTGAMAMTSTMAMTNATPLPPRPSTAIPAGMLRTQLDMLLGEHVLLAASATDAALRGRQDEFQAAANALDGNSVDSAAAIGAIYGPDAQAAFLPLWRKHIGFFVDYTTGLAKGDQARQDKALADLDQYAEDFGAFLQAANPNLPKDAVAGLLRQHAQTLIAVIKAQAMATPQQSGDQIKAYPALDEAYAHMDMEATALATGITKQFPERFSGDGNDAAAGLRSALNLTLVEHAYLLGKSAAAALAARDVEYEAAFAALDQNSQNLAAAVGSVYGDVAGKAFLPLWRKHIGFFVDYTLAVGQKDPKAQQMAMDNLTAYAADFGAFLHSANPNLPAAAVTELVKAHAATTLRAIDAAAGGNQAEFYAALREAYAHMAMIANPLADAIIMQFPDKFGEANAAPAPAMTMAMTATTTMTGTSTMTGAMTMTNQQTPGASQVTKGMTETPVSIPVVINTFAFKPARIEVPVGATVIWTNQDAIEHTVTAGAPDNKTGLFDSGLFNQGQQFSFTFTKTGEYTYFCQRHTSMRGVVVVVPAK